MSIVRYKGQLPSVLGSVFDKEFYNDDEYKTSYNKVNLPFVNVLEDDESFEIQLVAPGLEKKDFIIEVNNDVLHLASEKGEDLSNEDHAKFTRKEFSTTPFIRRFKLGDTIKRDEISAKYESGILYVFLPKIDEVKPKPTRTIKVS